MMRIAVASKGLDVSNHFGCCTNFNYYKVIDNQLVDSEISPVMDTYVEHRLISCARLKFAFFFAELFRKMTLNL